MRKSQQSAAVLEDHGEQTEAEAVVEIVDEVAKEEDKTKVLTPEVKGMSHCPRGTPVRLTGFMLVKHLNANPLPLALSRTRSSQKPEGLAKKKSQKCQKTQIKNPKTKKVIKVSYWLTLSMKTNLTFHFLQPLCRPQYRKSGVNILKSQFVK